MFSFPYSADHERDWPPCKEEVFFGLATNTLNVRNNNDFSLNSNNRVGWVVVVVVVVVVGGRRQRCIVPSGWLVGWVWWVGGVWWVVGWVR